MNDWNMKNNEYGKHLSEAYDALNTDVDYEEWAHFYCVAAEKHGLSKLNSVCDMACGTGALSVALEKKGCRVTAFDLSEDMLTLADKRARDEGAERVRFTRQDLRDFRVYAPVELCVCMMDGMNCLETPADVECAMQSAYRALCEDGLFIFDVNARHKFETVYAENAYLMEAEDVFLAWQNFYRPDNKKCDMYLTFFCQQPDGRYVRYDETVRERMYPVRTLDRLLARTGFTVLERVSDFAFTPADENECDRIFYICKKNPEALTQERE